MQVSFLDSTTAKSQDVLAKILNGKVIRIRQKKAISD